MCQFFRDSGCLPLTVLCWASPTKIFIHHKGCAAALSQLSSSCPYRRRQPKDSPVSVPCPGWGHSRSKSRPGSWHAVLHVPCQEAAGRQDPLPNTISILLKSFFFFFPVNCFITSYDYTVMIPGSNDRKYSLAHGQGSSSPEHVPVPEGITRDLQVSKTGN